MIYSIIILIITSSTDLKNFSNITEKNLHSDVLAWDYHFSLSRASKQTRNDKITSSFEDNDDVTSADCALAPSPRNSSVSVIPVQIKANNSLNNERCFRLKREGRGVTRRPSGFNIIDDPSSLVYLWISSSSVARRMEREIEGRGGGGREGGRKKATSPGKKMRWKIEGNHDSRLVSWNCIANGRSFNGGIMHDRFSMAHCWNSTGKRERGGVVSSLNVNDTVIIPRMRFLSCLVREISLSKD